MGWDQRRVHGDTLRRKAGQANKTLNYNRNMDVSKLKVADLKKELKARGLSVSGSKIELVERLQEATQDEDATENVLDNDDLLDEDAVLADESEEAILDEEDNVLLTPTSILASETKSPLKTPVNEGTTVTATKKVILNRNPISMAAIPAAKTETINSRKISVDMESQKETSNGDGSDNGEEKKSGVVKLGSLSAEERAKLRAQKFGVPIPDNAKKSVRAERFGLTTKEATKETSKETIKQAPTESKEVLDEKLLKRQARFGGVTAAEVDVKNRKGPKGSERRPLPLLRPVTTNSNANEP